MMGYETNTLNSKGNARLQPDCAIPTWSDDNFSFSAALVLKSDLLNSTAGVAVDRAKEQKTFLLPPRRYFSATKRYDRSSFYTKSEVSAEGLPWEVGRETGIPKDVSRFVSKNSRWPAHKTTFPFRLPAGGQKMCRPMAMLASSNPGHKNYRNQKELILPIRLSPALWSNRGRIQYYSLKIPHEYWKLYRYAEMRDCMLY